MAVGLLDVHLDHGADDGCKVDPFQFEAHSPVGKMKHVGVLLLRFRT